MGPASSRTELICFSAAWVQIVLVDRDIYKPMVGIWKMKEVCNLQLRNFHGIDKDLHILLATRLAKKIGHKSSLTKAMIEQYPCLYHDHHLDFASDAKGTSSKHIIQSQNGDLLWYHPLKNQFNQIQDHHSCCTSACSKSFAGSPSSSSCLHISSAWVFFCNWHTVDGSEIPNNHLRWVLNPVNNGIHYLSTGAGFLPSTVSLQHGDFDN